MFFKGRHVWRTVSIALGSVELQVYALPVGCLGEAMPGTGHIHHSRNDDIVR